MPQHIAKGIALGQLDPFTQLPFQAESVTPKLAVDDSFHPKSFKPETLKKKLDLPVQKNLLTKYFCFATMEAKRKFKAPTVTPTDESPSTPEDNATDVDALSSQTTNESPAYSLAENARASKVAEHRESSDEDAMERNHKDLDHKYIKQELERPKTDSVKVVVRSKYFKQKQEDTSLKQSIPCLNDGSVIGQRKTVKTVINKSSASSREESDTAIATSPCFHHERIYNDHEDGKEASFSARNEVAERTANIHKINHQINKEEQNPSVEILSTFSTPENVIPLSSISINRLRGAATGKRKLDSDENLEKIPVNPRVNAQVNLQQQRLAREMPENHNVEAHNQQNPQEQRKIEIERQRSEARLRLDQMQPTALFDESSRARELMKELGFKDAKGI